jgi:transcriptional regulator with XRE-family HTH domain
VTDPTRAFWAGVLADVKRAYNLTGAQVARIMNVTRGAVSSWEAGRALPAPFHRTLLAQLWEDRQDPVRFHRAMQAVVEALDMQPLVPAKPPTSQGREPTFKDALAAVGAVFLIKKLFD